MRRPAWIRAWPAPGSRAALAHPGALALLVTGWCLSIAPLFPAAEVLLAGDRRTPAVAWPVLRHGLVPYLARRRLLPDLFGSRLNVLGRLGVLARLSLTGAAGDDRRDGPA
jgi:hypothetical protein